MGAVLRFRLQQFKSCRSENIAKSGSTRQYEPNVYNVYAGNSSLLLWQPLEAT